MFGIIFVIGLFFVIKLMKKLKIEVDKNFVIALIPFILFGSTARALVDAKIYPHRPELLAFFFISPGIYVTIFFIALISLLIGIHVFKKNYYKFMLVTGSGLFAINLFQIITFLFSHFEKSNFNIFIVFLIFFMPFVIIYWLITKNFKISKFLKYEKNYVIVLAHFFDASTTYAGITFFNYFEKHVLPSLAIEIFSPAVMFMLKLVVIPALYFIDKIDDKTTRRMIKIAIFILGIAPAIRNFVRILLGV